MKFGHAVVKLGPKWQMVHFYAKIGVFGTFDHQKLLVRFSSK